MYGESVSRGGGMGGGCMYICNVLFICEVFIERVLVVEEYGVLIKF